MNAGGGEAPPCTWPPDYVAAIEELIVAATSPDCGEPVIDGDTDHLEPHPEWYPEDYVAPDPWPEPTTAQALAALDRIVNFCAKRGSPLAPEEVAARRQELERGDAHGRQHRCH